MAGKWRTAASGLTAALTATMLLEAESLPDPPEVFSDGIPAAIRV